MEVAIIGGGMGGLACFHSLKKFLPADTVITVYERDEGLDSRPQGYAIGLQASGIKSLTEIGLMDNITPFMDASLRGFRIIKTSLSVLMQFISNPKNMESALVPRDDLRRALAKGAKVVWNKRFSRLESLPSGRVKVYFQDETSIEVDLVVAADGAKSQIRAQLYPAISLESTNVGGIPGSVPLSVVEKLPEFQRLLRLSDDALVRALGPDGTSWLVLTCYPKGFQNPREVLWVMNFNFSGKFELPHPSSFPYEWKKLVLQTASLPGVDPVFQRLVELTPEDKFMKPAIVMSTNPAQIKANPWKNNKHSVVFIGDAAHAMTTHRGIGANTAFEDALILGKFLSEKKASKENRGAILEAVQCFHEEMSKRGSNAVAMSLDSTKSLHELSTIKTTIRDGMLWTIGCIMGSLFYIASFFQKQ